MDLISMSISISSVLPHLVFQGNNMKYMEHKDPSMTLGDTRAQPTFQCFSFATSTWAMFATGPNGTSLINTSSSGTP